MRIDSHHHFWNYSLEDYAWISEDMSVLRRDFGPADLAEVAGSRNIQSVISVQARQTIEETRWLLKTAHEHKLVQGVVGWLPLQSADVERQITEFSKEDLLKGLRHVVQDEPDDSFILGENFNRGVGLLKNYGLVYDILIFAKHLPATIQFVDRHPEQIFVLDHIAKPTIRAKQLDADWMTNIANLAKRPNVFCKFSGVVTEVRDAAWNLDSIRPYWDQALKVFGTDRMMFGSDWPVCLLRASYAEWTDVVEQLCCQLSDEEQQAFWHDNASRVYSLH